MIDEPAIAEFVKCAKPKWHRGLIDLLVWSWGILFVGIGIYLAHPGFLTFTLSFLIVTSRMGAALALAHDAQHAAFLPSKKWNDLIAAWLCAYPMGSIYGSSRAVHMAHHKLLNTPLDPDRRFHIESDKSTRRQLVVHFGRLVLGGQLWTSIVVNGFLRPANKQASNPVVIARSGHPEILNIIVVQLAIWGILFYLGKQWWLYPVLWLGPIFTLGTFLGFLRGFVDHALLFTDQGGMAKNRLVTVLHINPLERAFLAGFDFNYHAEHHLFPSVPHYYLPELHRLLQKSEKYRNEYGLRPSYSKFIAEYWQQISAVVTKPAVDVT